MGRAMRDLRIGDLVEQIVSSEYYFKGHITAKYNRRSGTIRFVVENGNGIEMIFSERELQKL